MLTQCWSLRVSWKTRNETYLTFVHRKYRYIFGTIKGRRIEWIKLIWCTTHKSTTRFEKAFSFRLSVAFTNKLIRYDDDWISLLRKVTWLCYSYWIFSSGYRKSYESRKFVLVNKIIAPLFVCVLLSIRLYLRFMLVQN